MEPSLIRETYERGLETVGWWGWEEGREITCGATYERREDLSAKVNSVIFSRGLASSLLRKKMLEFLTDVRVVSK